jgi:hypothetical protein
MASSSTLLSSVMLLDCVLGYASLPALETMPTDPALYRWHHHPSLGDLRLRGCAVVIDRELQVVFPLRRLALKRDVNHQNISELFELIRQGPQELGDIALARPGWIR